MRLWAERRFRVSLGINVHEKEMRKIYEQTRK